MKGKWRAVEKVTLRQVLVDEVAGTPDSQISHSLSRVVADSRGWLPRRCSACAGRNLAVSDPVIGHRERAEPDWQTVMQPSEKNRKRTNKKISYYMRVNWIPFLVIHSFSPYCKQNVPTNSRMSFDNLSEDFKQPKGK